MSHGGGTGSHPRRRSAALIASATAAVGLATGILTLSDQLLGGEPEAPVVVAQRQAQEIKEFRGRVGHFLDGRAFIEFLIANDRETVLLDVTVPVAGGVDSDNIAIKGPAVKTDCVSDFCNGVEIVVLGESNPDTHFGQVHGEYALEGYFALDVSSREWQGVRPVVLKPRTRKQANADAI